MENIYKIKDGNGVIQYPITSEKAVNSNNGVNIDEKFTEVDEKFVTLDSKVDNITSISNAIEIAGTATEPTVDLKIDGTATAGNVLLEVTSEGLKGTVNVTQEKFIVVNELPSEGNPLYYYLVRTITENVYDEYVWAEISEDTFDFVFLGDTTVDLSNYATIDDLNTGLAIKANVTDVYTQLDVDTLLVSKADANVVDAMGIRVSTAETKLETIAEGAEINVQADWGVTDANSDAFILNKPNIPLLPVNNEYSVLNDGNFVDLFEKGYVEQSYIRPLNNGNSVAIADSEQPYWFQENGIYPVINRISFPVKAAGTITFGLNSYSYADANDTVTIEPFSNPFSTFEEELFTITFTESDIVTDGSTRTISMNSDKISNRNPKYWDTEEEYFFIGDKTLGFKQTSGVMGSSGVEYTAPHSTARFQYQAGSFPNPAQGIITNFNDTINIIFETRLLNYVIDNLKVFENKQSKIDDSNSVKLVKYSEGGYKADINLNTGESKGNVNFTITTEGLSGNVELLAKDISDVYSKTETNNLLDSKADTTSLDAKVNNSSIFTGTQAEFDADPNKENYLIALITE